MSKSGSEFRFKSTDEIGAAAAEDDPFLQTCFIDTGEYERLMEMTDNKVIFLGRTGVGKSALFEKLSEDHGNNVLRINPDSLAIAYLENTGILEWLSDKGVNFEPFFKLLWRHVLTVEVLSRYFEDYEANSSKQNPWEYLCSLFFESTDRRDKRLETAIEYLKNWGESFWKDTDVRVKEITQKLANSLEAAVAASLKIPVAEVNSKLKAVESIEESLMADVIQRTREIVAKTQVRDLERILEVLSFVLKDKHKNYYVIIDRLDENWVDEGIKSKLIMALIETAQDFRSVENAKVVLALRRDLIERVFRLERGPGYQEEKIDSLCARITWTPAQIHELLDKRISKMVRRRYTKKSVGFKDILPPNFGRTDIDKFVFSIAPRPRDAIAFINTAIQASVDDPRISKSKFSLAIGNYSRLRIRALADEWASDYPNLLDFCNVLKKWKPQFALSDFPFDKFDDICLDIVGDTRNDKNCILYKLAEARLTGEMTLETFGLELIHAFYKVGLVGLKVSANSPFSFADDSGQAVSMSELTTKTNVAVHPTFHRVLGLDAVG